MSWVKDALEKILSGQSADVRPLGGSMRGRIESGPLVTIVPATIVDIAPSDVVLVRWRGNYLLHLALQIDGGRILIGNNVGKVNGWVEADAVLGKVTEIHSESE